MSLRDQILEQLTEHPEGLTSKELAPLCESSEGDAAMVGRVIAALRTENVIHPGTELRDGGAIWIFGPEKREVVESKVTLPYRPDAKPPPPVSEAARAIAEMRRDKSTPERVPARASQPATRPSPASGGNHQETADMSTVRDRITAALKEHGPMTSRALGKYVKAEGLGKHCFDLVRREILKSYKGDGPRSSIYALPNQELADRQSPEKPEAPRPPSTPRSPKKPAKAKKAKAPARRAAPAPEESTNGDARFAIDEAGMLGIEKDDTKLALEPAEFERLRDFIERTKPVWDGAGA